MKVRYRSLVISWLVFLPAFEAFCETLSRANRVPDEFESPGGHALGLGNAGMAALSEQSSVRANPAMLGFEKQYTIAGGYHWPSLGREFYQAGAVDSKTSPVAAGITYTSAKERFTPLEEKEGEKLTDEKKAQQWFDSPILYRFSLGMAKTQRTFALGFGVQYVEGFLPEEDNLLKKNKGMTLGGGIAGLLTPDLRVGFGAENLANDRVKDLAPRIYRAGLAYTMLAGNFTLQLDYSQRQRVRQELLPLELEGYQFQKVSNEDQKMALISTTIRVQDFLRLLMAYGQEVGGEDKPRRTAACGLALVNADYSLSYLLSNPYLEDAKTHQALNLSFQVSI